MREFDNSVNKLSLILYDFFKSEGVSSAEEQAALLQIAKYKIEQEDATRSAICEMQRMKDQTQ